VLKQQGNWFISLIGTSLSGNPGVFEDHRDLTSFIYWLSRHPATQAYSC